MDFKLEDYGSTIGSFVISAVRLKQLSKFRAVKYLERMKKKDDFRWSEEYKTLIHNIRIYFSIPEDLPIAGVITETNNLVFVPFIDSTLLSILDNNPVFGALQYPKRVFDLYGKEIYTYNYIYGKQGELKHVEKKD